MSHFVVFITPHGEEAVVRASEVITINPTSVRVGGLRPGAWINFRSGRGVLVVGSSEDIQKQLDEALDAEDKRRAINFAAFNQR